MYNKKKQKGKEMLKYFYIFTSIVFLFAGCTNKKRYEIQLPHQNDVPIASEQVISQELKGIEENVAESAEEKNFAQEDLSWNGYYFGILPNHEKTWLYLQGNKNNTTYELIKNVNNNISVKNDMATWLESDSVLKLGEEFLFVGDKFVSFLDSPNAMLKNQYTLEKLEVYESLNSTIYLSPKSMQSGKIKGQKAWRLSSVENFRQNAGFSSTQGTYVLNCANKTYNPKRIMFYDKSFAMGNLVKDYKQNSDVYINIESNSAFEKLFDKYCTQENK